jgi:hypothetical protein
VNVAIIVSRAHHARWVGSSATSKIAAGYVCATPAGLKLHDGRGGKRKLDPDHPNGASADIDTTPIPHLPPGKTVRREKIPQNPLPIRNVSLMLEP